MIAKVMLMLFAILAFSSAAMADSMYDGQTPNREWLVHFYHQGPSDPVEWSINDIQFHSSESFPRSEDLTDAEVYIISGALTSTKPDTGLAAWVNELRFFAAEYYRVHGFAPTRFDYETAVSLPHYSSYPESFSDLWINPITGNWTPLAMPARNPGDVFVHFLTDEEMRHFAVRNEEYKKMFFLDSFPDVNSPVGRSVREPATRPFFIQIIGDSGNPIIEKIYVW